MEDKTNPFVRPPFLASEGMYSPSNIKLKQDPMPNTLGSPSPLMQPANTDFPPIRKNLDPEIDLISKAMQLLGPEKATAETYRMLSEAPLGDVMKLVDQLMPKSAN